MKVYLVILMMFFTGASTSVYAGDNSGDSGGGLFSAIGEFLASLFENDDDAIDKGDDERDEDSEGTGDNTASHNSNGPAKGTKSIPVLGNNDQSAAYIAARISADTGWPKEEMMPYSVRLARTLSQLTAKEQAEVFYGTKN